MPMSEKLGRYRLMKLLATGGMGEVFLARQEGPGGFAKMVVVKRILRHLARDQGFIDLFLNEARLAAQLQHPNIVQAFNLEHEADSWFIAMEYVHGTSLREVLHRAKARGSVVPATIACRLASQVLQGLHFAHELTDERGQPLGILHRDVSPENVLVSFSGVVKLIDFGIARAMTGAPTRVGNPKGKVAYMAPELTVSGAEVDRRADVYAVGVLLYEMLRLNLPPNVPTTAQEATSAPRREYVPEVMIPRLLNDVLARAMAPELSARFPSANAMSEALEVYLMAVGQTVLPTHVHRYLEALLGPEAFEVNSSVVPLDAGVGPSGLTRIPSAGSLVQGTAPLTHGTAPLVRSSSLQPLPVVPLEEPTVALTAPEPERRLGLPLVVGAITAAVMTFLISLALWPKAAPAPAVVEAPEPAEAVALAPAAEQPHLDAGEMTILLEPESPRPGAVAAPVVDAGPSAPVEVAAPASRKSLGHVLVRVTPPTSEVYYLGRKVAVPSVEVPAGAATFVLRNPKLGINRKVTVKVGAGATVVLRADLSQP